MHRNGLYNKNVLEMILTIEMRLEITLIIKKGSGMILTVKTL